MLPQNLVEFIFYIIPGFLVLEVYRSFRPAKQRDEFHVIAWSIVYGILIASLVSWVDVRYFGNALGSATPGFPGISLIFVLVLSGVFVGLVGALYDKLRGKVATSNRRLQAVAPAPKSVWAKINAPSVQDWAVVFLQDGSIYLGWIAAYTFDPESKEQDFLLSHAKRVNVALEEMYSVDGLGVYLNTGKVTHIEFVKGKSRTQAS